MSKTPNTNDKCTDFFGQLRKKEIKKALVIGRKLVCRPNINPEISEVSQFLLDSLENVACERKIIKLFAENTSEIIHVLQIMQLSEQKLSTNFNDKFILKVFVYLEKCCECSEITGSDALLKEIFSMLANFFAQDRIPPASLSFKTLLLFEKYLCLLKSLPLINICCLVVSNKLLSMKANSLGEFSKVERKQFSFSVFKLIRTLETNFDNTKDWPNEHFEGIIFYFVCLHDLHFVTFSFSNFEGFNFKVLFLVALLFLKYSRDLNSETALFLLKMILEDNPKTSYFVEYFESETHGLILEKIEHEDALIKSLSIKIALIALEISPNFSKVV